MTTLKEALALAQTHWSGRPGGSVMGSTASACVAILGASTGLETLGAPDGVRLLAALRDKGLSPKSVASYYGAFRRLMTLNDCPPSATWPKAPAAPKRTRDRLDDGDLARIDDRLRSEGHTSTADLGKFLRATGMRVRIEGLRVDAWKLTLSPYGLEVLRPDGHENYDVLHITGKGDHERMIPLTDPFARDLVRDSERLKAIARWSYETHLDRWNSAVKACGVKSRLATFHAIRHGYASDALSKSGGNLAMVQQLLGHADPATTARYLHVDLSAKAKVLAS